MVMHHNQFATWLIIVSLVTTSSILAHSTIGKARIELKSSLNYSEVVQGYFQRSSITQLVRVSFLVQHLQDEFHLQLDSCLEETNPKACQRKAGHPLELDELERTCPGLNAMIRVGHF